ncbi:MAG: adenosine deaminase [Microthrixaceae bacterium]
MGEASVTDVPSEVSSSLPSEWFSALPKVELHCHVEGTMRPSTIAELSAAHGVSLPAASPDELFTYGDLTGFLRVFWFVQSVLRAPEDWERLAYESIVDAAPHGLRYREMFFTPARHLEDGQHLADIVAALDRGLNAAEQETGTRCRLIFDIDRDFGPSVAIEHVRHLVELRRSGAPGFDRVIGLGMDSTEAGIDPASFLPAYELACRGGLRRTAHQGENSPASAIATAVDVLGCERIDHGISIFGDPQLVRRLAERRLPLTVCPNANVRINPDVVADIADHVYPAMRDAGLLATLNTDDPALVGLDLTQEYELTAAAFGYSAPEMVDIALDGVAGSWLDESDAAMLSTEITAYAAATGEASASSNG